MNKLYVIIGTFFGWLINKLPYPAAKTSFLSSLKRLEKLDRKFYTFHNRSIVSDNINLHCKHNTNSPLCAVIIQGPIVVKDNFTLQTCMLYKKSFCNAKIIVSTWDDQDKETLNKMVDEGIHVVVNKLPEYRGPLNINYQILSTKAGIKKAKELKASYIFKSRADQRFYKYNMDAFMIDLINSYPLPEEWSKTLYKRLLSINFTTLKYRLYAISDMMIFGTTEDIDKYWSPQYDDRKQKDYKDLSIYEFSKFRYAETYLTTDFLKRIGWNLKWTLEDSWNAYRSLFITIDYQIFDFYWNKYFKELEYKNKYYQLHSHELFSFSDWISKLSPDYIENEFLLNQKEGR